MCFEPGRTTTWLDGAALAFFPAIAVFAWFAYSRPMAAATMVFAAALINRQFNSGARFVAVRSSKRLQGKA